MCLYIKRKKKISGLKHIMYKMHIRHPNCIYAKEKKDKTRVWIHITRRVRIRHPNCSHTKKKKNENSCITREWFDQSKVQARKTAGTRVTGFVRCEWTRTRRKELVVGVQSSQWITTSQSPRVTHYAALAAAAR